MIMTRPENYSIRPSFAAIGVALAGLTVGILLAGAAANRQAAAQLEDLQAKAVPLARRFEDVAGADTFVRFARGVVEISKAVTEFGGLSFPRVEPIEDDVTLAMFKAASGFLDAAMCWADYEDPGGAGLEGSTLGEAASAAPSEATIEAKRKALEQRLTEATLAPALTSKAADRRLNLARDAEEGVGDDTGLSRAQAAGEARRLAEARLAAAECVQKRRAEGLNTLNGVYSTLGVPH
jgi:hypothetical protein